jgi:Tol biopolymer transport system component
LRADGRTNGALGRDRDLRLRSRELSRTPVPGKEETAMKPRMIPFAIVLLGSLPAGTALASAQATERVSVASNGAEADQDSWDGWLSGDGRFVAFSSAATNLVPNDLNLLRDIFVHDRLTGLTERVNVSSAGAEANDASELPAISADGRCVVFQSKAANLVATSSRNMIHVYLHDRAAGTTERVSLDANGGLPNNVSSRPSISADGRFVAFESYASDMVANDTNGEWDVFVRDRLNGTNERVSVDSSGVEGNAWSWDAAISADGRFVAFESWSSNLAAGDANGTFDVFVHDRQTGVTACVSVDAAGVPGNGMSTDPAISADGRFVAFGSSATNLVAGDANGWPDVFVRDLQTGTTTLVSLSNSGAQVVPGGGHPWISGDGRFVTFDSDASDLVAGDTNGSVDVFVRDLLLATTVRVSVGAGGVEGDQASGEGSVSLDGRHFVFSGGSDDFVAGDTNQTGDVFVRGPWLTLAADPPGVAAGATLTLASWRGEPAGVTLLALVDIDGVPLFVPALVSTYDAAGGWSLATTVPPGLSGSVLTLRSYGFVPTGKVQASNDAAITFQ